MNRQEVVEIYKQLQAQICSDMEAIDGAQQFMTDEWIRTEGGGGITRVMEKGKVIARGGVNFSEVEGTLSPAAAKALKIDASKFFATGISIVMHPVNPWVPIIHMNVRYFETDSDLWWFGGGIDLTPHYIFPESAARFHEHLKKHCDTLGSEYYPEFKKWADDYFYLPHRKETRGVGGIFFDRLNASRGLTQEQLLEFTTGLAKLFVPIYSEQINDFKAKEFAAENLDWQALRRSRYVEFNLAWDRGTKFGLETNGRTESILMSMPPSANWKYDYKPAAGSQEEQTLALLKKDIDWLSYL